MRIDDMCAGRGRRRAGIWFGPCIAGTLLFAGATDRTAGQLFASEANRSQPVPIGVASPAGADKKLEQARNALTGEKKNTERAQKLLLEIVENEKTALDPSELCHAYVYLGYIEDRANHRERAISWYKRAIEIEGAGVWIRRCASEGMKAPLTWIRHLDERTPPKASTPSVKPLGRPTGYVTTEQPPGDLVPAETLSPEERQANFEFLCDAIDKTYAHFELKGIDWPQVCGRYRQRLGQAQTADEFYELLFGLVNQLKDTHSWLQNRKPARRGSGPGLTVSLFESRAFVVAVDPRSDAAAKGLKPGAEILEIDGLAVPARIERLRPRLSGQSSERAMRREAAHGLLAGDQGTTVTLKLRSPDSQTNQTLALKRDVGLGSEPARTCPIPLTRQRFVHFGRHASGLGYIWVESFNGRQEIAREFDRALDDLRAAPGLVLDIRGNTGGYGTAQPHIVGRLITNHTLVAISYRKNGPGHQDLEKHEERFGPGGGWQYTRPVALLVDDLTGSAADLFACYLRSAGRVVTIGTTTHGNLSGVAAYAVLPCGLIVRVSNGYVCDAKNRPIEGNGNEPDVTVSPTVTDCLNGWDPVLEKAIAFLADKGRPN